MNGKSTEQLLEELILLMSQQKTGTSDKNNTASSDAYKKYLSDFKNLIKETKSQTDYLKKVNETSLSFSRSLSPIPKTLDKVDENLNALDRAIKNETDERKKQVLEGNRARLLRQATEADSIDAAKKFGDGLKKVGSIGVTAVGTFIKGLQSGQSGIQLASGLLEAQYSAQGEASSAAGQAAGSFGQILAMTGKGPVKSFGLALSIIGPALGFLGEAANKLAKFGVQVLSAEVEKTVNSFKEATSSGALFSRGMDDLRMYATQAGLTVDQYSKVIKNNSQLLAESGYTVSGAAKIVAGVTSNLATQTGKSGNTLQRELLNLGFGFEEQAELVARVTANLKRSGGTATNAQVAQSTVEMARNLRIVADLMGDDAKARTENAKKASEAYAFEREIRERAKKTGDVGLIDRVRKAMSMMDETQQRAVIQAVSLNGAVTDVSANLFGMAAPAREFVDQLNKGNTSVEDLMMGFARANQNFDRNSGDLARAISIGSIAGVTGLEGLAKSADSLNQMQFKVTEENLNRASKDSKTASEANGKFQKSTIGAEIAAQRLKIALQFTLTRAIEQFAKVSKAMLGEVETMIKQLGLNGDKPSREEANGGIGSAESIGDHVVGAGLGLAALGTLLAVGGAGLSATGIGAPIGAPMMAAGSTMAYGGLTTMGVGASISGFSSMIDDKLSSYFGKTPGYETGGVSYGDISRPQGILSRVSEKGINEAHVPLPDGRSIPVNLGKISSESGSENKKMALSGLDMPVNRLDLLPPDFSKSISNLMSSLESKQVKEQTVGDQSKIEMSKSEALKSDQTIELLKEQLGLMKQFISNSGEHLEALRDSKYLQQQLVNNSYS